MGLSEVLTRLALRATQVLVVEVPGWWLTRVELEQQLLHRGWRPAWTPADADLIAVCGIPGPELSDLVEHLWEQIPGPRARIEITSTEAVNSALDDAAGLLLDTSYQRVDARKRAQKPRMPEDTDGGGHGGMDDDEHGGHGEMEMAPEGIPLAEGGEDRDGLELDVLHLPLGPVLPFWPVGLVLRCSLQGDVVVDAEVSVIDVKDDGDAAGKLDTGVAPADAVGCDQALGLLALAGAEDAAAQARRARDALLRGDRDAAGDAVERLHRMVQRSRLLRWSLHDVLRLDHSDVRRHELPERCLGDAYDRLLSLVQKLRRELCEARPVSVNEGVVAWTVVPHLVAGLELATVRLAVASLGLGPLPVSQEVTHD